MPETNPSPLIVVISGPSGAGKDVIIERMADLGHDFHFTVTATTRKPRPNETDGINHHFISQEEFKRLIATDELLEWAIVYGNYYGTPKQQVRDALKKGLHVILRVDVQGALRVKEIVPDSLLIFINAPDLDVLRQRLLRRNVNNEKDIRIRLEAAQSEMGKARIFDFQVINHEGLLDAAVVEVVSIISQESRSRPSSLSKI